MEFAYKITVFTPAYNRAHTLEKLYRSLQRQTFQNFEWLIVDDGSSDGTGELVNKWQAEENSFPIHYAWQENGGKCRAINHGLKLAAGELFFTVDSDDYQFRYHADSVQTEGRKGKRRTDCCKKRVMQLQ